MLFWHVPAPNEALLISGSKRRGQGGPEFRIVTGHGCFVLPIKQKWRVLSLSLREAEIVEDVITKQGIRLKVRAVTVFKVGDDPASIANAARRFLAEQTQIESLVGRIFAGHLRSIIGGLTVEEIISDRDRVAQEIKDGCHTEMEKLGLVVDGLAIQEVEDTTGYINNLAAPHSAAVASQARIAAAKADEEATQREQEAAALKAQYIRDASISQAGYSAEVDRAKAEAAQAGPLAQAQASQNVIEQQTLLAQRQAELAAQKLEAEVRRPADAEAYKQRTLAEAARDTVKMNTEAEVYRKVQLATADRDSNKLSVEAESLRRRQMAEADADAIKASAEGNAQAAKSLADGEAYKVRQLAQADSDSITVRAASLASGNQELIAAKQLVDNLPEIVAAASSAIGSSNLTVLNGGEGLNQLVAQVVAQGLSVYHSLRQSVAAPAAKNGATHAAQEDGNAEAVAV
ncbi:MAG TPA: SPFH domain-containing protein [Acidimicrobiales bacterium]|nr:SPFH domain-containing protein [Acidimicrobiales bacterium]